MVILKMYFEVIYNKWDQKGLPDEIIELELKTEWELKWQMKKWLGEWLLREEGMCKGPVTEKTDNIKGNTINGVYLEHQDQDGNVFG